MTVEVTVRLFAMLRERAGTGSVTLELPEGARVRDALDSLSGLAEGIPLVMAVNREYASEEQVLGAGDELALIPPVSGGAPWARVSAEPLSLDALAARVRDPRAGAVVTFAGVTREVDRLEYEAYAEMAEERMGAIAAEDVRRRTEPDPELPPAEALAHSLDAFLAWVEGNDLAYRKLLESAGSVPEVGALIAEVRDRTSARILEGLGAGAAPAPRAAVRAWLWFVDGAILDWLEHRDLTRPELKTLLLRALEGALGEPF